MAFEGVKRVQSVGGIARRLLDHLPTPLAGLFRPNAAPEPENPQVIYLPPPTDFKIQEDIETVAGGLNVRGYRSFIPDAQDTVIFALGHRNRADQYRHTIRLLNKLRLNVVIVELPEPENNDHFADGRTIDEGYRDVIGDTVLNGHSEFFRYIPPDMRIRLMTHSSSGLGFELNVMQDEEKAQFAEDKFNLVIHSAPMLDTAGSSHKHHRTLSDVYQWYSQLKSVKEKVVGTAFLDSLQQTFNAVTTRPLLSLERAWKGQPLYYTTPEGATHGQAFKLKSAGIALFAFVEEQIQSGALSQQSVALRINRFFSVSKTDNATDYKTTRDYAQTVGGECSILDKGGHAWLTSYKAGRKEILERLTDNSPLLMPRPRQPEQVVHTPAGSVDTPRGELVPM